MLIEDDDGHDANQEDTDDDKDSDVDNDDDYTDDDNDDDDDGYHPASAGKPVEILTGIGLHVH